MSSGVKFSAEEERTVIELQAQFGNKWARIATYLPGRTDNDVKNFWSSRQKKLARILRTSVQQPSKPQKTNNREAPALQKHPSVEGPKLSSLAEERSLSISQYCPSSYMNNCNTINMVQLPELLNSTSLPFEPDLLQPEFNPYEKRACFGSQIPLPFPQIPLQTDFLHPLESQILPMKLEESDFLDFFGQLSASEIGNVQVPFVPSSCSGPERSSDIISVKREIDIPLTPDSFIDDFPMDMFDHIDPLPSPFNW